MEVAQTGKYSKAVNDNFAEGADHTKKEVEDIMYGPTLDYEAKRILNSGIEQGIEKGRLEERQSNIEKIAENYLKNGLAQTKEEALGKAKALLA